MAAILKIVKRHISVKNSPILMKFGTLHQILSPITVTLPNIEIFEIQDGGGRHLENRFYSHSSSTIVRFQRNFVWESRTPWQQGLHDKIYKFLKSDFDEIPYTTANVEADYSHVTKFLKFKMAAAAILKIAFLAITHQPIFRFQRHFALKSRTACQQRLRDKKLQIFKIQDGRRPPFWKSLNQLKLSHFDEIWHTTADIGPNYSHLTKNWNFKNSRWRRPPSWKSLFRP